MTAKCYTLRLPVPLFEKAVALARKRDISLNRLFQEGIGQLCEAEEQNRLFHEFTMIAGDAQDADVEFASVAQAEVVRHEP